MRKEAVGPRTDRTFVLHYPASLYVSIRLTTLPWYIYSGFPYLGIGQLILLFSIAYDIVLMTRSSEAVLEDLQSTGHVSLRGLSLSTKRNILKRAKACRPYVLSVYCFTNYSLTVPVVVWEEILNQLFCLLTY